MNVIKEIMDMGVLVEPKAAEHINRLNEHEIKAVIERIKKEKPLVIGEDFFENVFEVVEKKHEQKKYTVHELVAVYNRYYQKMSEYFVKKKNTVSISNVFGDASVIGIVKNVKNNEAEIEDPTGEIKVRLKDGIKLINDEIVLVSGIVKDKVLHAEFVEYPNIKNTPKISGKKCTVCFNGNCGDYKIFFDNETRIEKDSLFASSNPVYVKINNILILVFNTKDPVTVLSKRCFYPGRIYEENILDEVPDYFLCFSGVGIKDYNGVKIIGINEKQTAKIELHTGRVEINKKII